MLARKLELRDLAEVCIRLADPEDDLELLAESLGQGEFFADRLSRQKCGNGELLIAWMGDRPIGDAYLWLEEAEEPELRDCLPDVPLLTHVEIHEDYRSRGIGTQLIAAAERSLIELGHQRVALAVEKSNVRAANLYARLGYRMLRRQVHCALFGESDESPEICHVMIKDL